MGGMGKIANWVNAPWLGFDTETTGVVPTRDRLVTAATVFRAGGGTFSLGETPLQVETWLAQPSVEIPTGAARIHGITTEYAAKHGTPVTQVLEEVNAALASHLDAGWPLVVFNAGFDLPLLAADSVRHGVAPLEQRLSGGVAPVVDPLVLDRALVKFRRGKRTLTDLLRAYGVDVPSDTHQAEVDATLTLSLLAAMVEAHPILVEMTSADVHDFQAVKHAEWAESLEKYLHNQGRPSMIDRNWF